jgi:hypothetical protein
MALTIEPASLTIGAGDTQLFNASQDGKPIQAVWDVIGAGTIDGNLGAYTTPNLVFISKKAIVVAKDQGTGAQGAATVVISASHTWIPVAGAYLGVAAAILVATLWFCWPSAKPGRTAFLAGSLGACLHGINSLIAYVGARKFTSSWAPFYLSRPFAGGILGLIVFWVFQGGLLGNQGQDAGIYAVAAVAGLVGLFSDVTMKKLEDVVGGLFSGKPDQRSDKLDSAQTPKPVISGINPTSIKAGGKAQRVEISGTGLVEGSQVKVNGNIQKIISHTPPSKLVVELDTTDVQAPGNLKLVVVTPGGSSSDEFLIDVQ